MTRTRAQRSVPEEGAGEPGGQSWALHRSKSSSRCEPRGPGPRSLSSARQAAPARDGDRSVIFLPLREMSPECLLV